MIAVPHNAMTIYFDPRWSGDHGIGRFANQLEKALHLPPLAVSGRPTSPAEPWRLLLAMLKLPPEAAVFSPGYNAPLFTVRPYIFTIHDLNHLDRPENSSFLKRLYYRLIMRPSARRALRVLTVSEFSRARIIAWAGLSPEQVINVGNGVDASYHPDVKPYAPGYPYLLCVGNRKGHKNEARVVEAFARAGIDPAIRLLFTGDPNGELDQLGRTLSVKERLVFLGRVPEKELPGIYRGALALLFPSLYEGFGLPVIEAMACGTPVLTANTTALPEVAGDAALLVDPLSVAEIAAGIERLGREPALREELHRRGLARAPLFNWKTVADRVRTALYDRTGL